VELLPGSERDAVALVWERLEAEGADPGPFASWLWTRTWLEHFGTTVSHCFATVLTDGEPVGLALLTFDRHRRGPFTFRRVHLGTAGEPPRESVFVERNRFLATPGNQTQVGAALIRFLEGLSTIDEIAVDGFLRDQAMALIGTDAGWLIEPERCHVVDLSAAPGGDVAALWSPGVRKELRRAERVLGRITVEWADDEARGHEMLDDLVALHQARWTLRGHGGAFPSKRVEQFHHALITQWVPRGRMALMKVVSEQGLVGARYAFVDGDRLLGYQSGWVPSEDRRLSVGLVLQHAVLQEAQRRGFTCWDYLAGSSEQKRRLSTGEYELLWATRRRPGFKWVAFDAARAVRSLTRAS
jgi:hypothetical protein